MKTFIVIDSTGERHDFGADEIKITGMCVQFEVFENFESSAPACPTRTVAMFFSPAVVREVVTPTS